MPLNGEETLADLARAMGAPVVLVVGLRLGCLNHALLTAEADAPALGFLPAGFASLGAACTGALPGGPTCTFRSSGGSESWPILSETRSGNTCVSDTALA